MFNKEKQEKRKSKRRYWKMVKRHRKELIKMAKEDCDFDYGFLHKLVVLKLKNMYEYYLAGDNVLQSDETKDKVIETLKHALELAEKINNFWEIDLEVFKSYESYESYNKAETQTYIDFYSYIGENIQWWWD